jgi:hypothetical protein
MDKLFSFILSFPSSGAIIYLKAAFLALSLLFLAGILILLSKSSWMKFRYLESWTEFFAYRPFGEKKTFKQWLKILKRLDSGVEADYKLSIIEADGLLADTLKKMGYSGQTLGETLKQLDSSVLPDLEKVLAVHKIRNNIVHDPDYRLTPEAAKNALSVYEETFRLLEMF